LFVYRGRDKGDERLEKIRQEYQVAALRNRKEGLKY